MQKKGIKYLRYSSDGQSNSSIEWQDTNTNQWCKTHNVLVEDVFIDAGYSAKTFDRPDFEKLTTFIAKNYKTVDYLIVNQLDRFSREAGEAISLIKKLQLKFSIQIVSVTEGIIYDYYTPGSHFRSGLQLLLAEDNNIDRTLKINGGVYTAKATEKRYIGAHAPYGYTKTGFRKEARLEIVEEEAAVIKEIYNQFLSGTPIKMIYEFAVNKGMKRRGNSSIQKLLQNPIYSGQQYVKPFKDHPGGLYPLNNVAIIDMYTWQLVQRKFKQPSTHCSITDSFPLRGVINCHCGRQLTAAHSTGKLGKKYPYYKCNTTSSHNNINANFAHHQIDGIMEHLSLPDYMIEAIVDESDNLMNIHLVENKKELQRNKLLLEKAETDLFNLEKKWIADQCSFETYNRWYNDLTQQRVYLKSAIEKNSRDDNELHFLLKENIYALSDMLFVYQNASTLEKQELIKLVFDNRLYYKNKIYRTPHIMQIFEHNTLILKQKQLLELDEKRDFSYKVPLGGAAGNRTLVQTYSP